MNARGQIPAPRRQQPLMPCETRSARAALRMVLLVTALTGWDAGAADPFVRHFRAGVLIGANIDAEFSQTGTFGVPASQDGIFDDGFVLVDDTGNAGERTAYWGYNDASQLDGANSRLILSRTSSFDATDEFTANSDPQFGLDLAYGGTLKRIGKTWISWELGFSLLPISVHGNSSTPTTFGQESVTFSTAGLVVPLAPYSGSPSGAGGPLLRTNIVGTTTSTNTGSLSASREIDTMLYNLRLGPHLHWDLTRAWSVEAMGGFAVALADGQYQYKERVLSATGETSTSGDMRQTSWLYGGYAGVLTQIHVERNAYFYGSAQFMTLGDVNFSEGGREARLKLGQGLYFSVGFTWLF